MDLSQRIENVKNAMSANSYNPTRSISTVVLSAIFKRNKILLIQSSPSPYYLDCVFVYFNPQL